MVGCKHRMTPSNPPLSNHPAMHTHIQTTWNVFWELFPLIRSVMGVLYKYKSCPDGFIVFICGTTCVSIQRNELVMRNIECKGSAVCAVLQIWLTSSRAKNKPLNLFLLWKGPPNPPLGLSFNLLEISKAQLSLSYQKTSHHPCLSSSMPLSSSLPSSSFSVKYL